LAKGKILSTIISFGGKVDGSLLKALNQSKSQANKTAKSMNKVMSDSTKAAGKAMTNSFRSAAAGALKVYAVVKSLSRLKDFARETITAAKAQIEVETKLASVLENVKSIQIRGPNAAAEAAKSLKNVADTLEKTGVIGADITMAGMQQLATYQLSEKEISTLSAGMTDLLAQQKGLNASQSDAVSIGNLIGKAMTGNVGALSRVGITFSEAQAEAIKTGDATLRAATIAQVLQENVGGVNKALGETDQGQLLQSQNTFDEIREVIGYFLLPLLNKFIKNILPYAREGLTRLTAVLEKAGPVVSELISKGFNKFSEILPFISEGVKEFLPLFGQLSSPFGLLGQLLPVIILAFQELWPAIQDVLKILIPLSSQFISSLIPALQSLIPPIANIIQKLLPVFISLITTLAPPIQQVVTQIVPLVGILLNSLLPAIDLLIPPIMKMITSLLPVFMKLFNSIISVFRSLAPVISVVAQVFASILIGAMNAVLPVITGIINHFRIIMDVLSEVINFIVNIFTGNWSGAWENIKNIFAGIFEGIVNYAKIPLNNIIGLVNGAISGINGLTGIINKIPGVNIGEIPQIPYLAKGATVTSPTLAMIGEGKVPETVVPHNNSPRSRALLNEAARGVGINNDMSFLSAADKILSSLTYFSDKLLRKNGQNSESSVNQTTNNGGTVNHFYFSPVVHAKDAEGVREVLDDEFEKFKAWFKQLKDEDDREVFA
jgi:phage-related protein